MTPAPTIITVGESSQVFEARRAAIDIVRSLGWDEEQTGRIAIAATEIATNLVKHARDGEMHLRRCERQGQAGIEVLALDRGPGLIDAAASLRDGFSTKGTAGTGLGAVRRLSNEFDLYSQSGKGLAVVARFYAEDLQEIGPDQLNWGVTQVPIRGESVCGDHWGIRVQGEKTIVAMADGLGHGFGAAQASQEAIAVLDAATELEPAVLLDSIHLRLRPTRGAAVAVVNINASLGNLTFAGVGNISAMIFHGNAIQHLVSLNGTAGQAIRKIQDFTYPWPSGALLILHSDGLNTSWRLDSYPGLAVKHPSLIAGVLYRDAARGRDDACVVVLRGAI